MSTPRQRPGPEQPRQSRHTRIRSAEWKSQNEVGTAIGEAPQSLRYRLGVAGVIILLIVVFVTIFTNAMGSRKDSYSVLDLL